MQGNKKLFKLATCLAMSAYANGVGISIGSATGTRLDSAAKHIMACRVHTNLMKRLIPQNLDPDRELMRDKNKYCVTKDEMVMNVSASLFKTGLSPPRSAYPLIVSNLADINQVAQNHLVDLYRSSTPQKFDEKLNEIASQIHRIDLMHTKYLPFCTFQGYSLGTAWASDKTGDTVCSVIIGGMITVRNGAFPMQTGQMVQWYFDFEQDEFTHEHSQHNEHGARHGNNGNHQNKQSNLNHKRQKFNDERDYGMPVYGTDGATTSAKSKTVFRIKPYKMFRHNQQQSFSDHYGDKIRVFGKCLGCAEPWGFVDIMLMTQSL